MVQVRGCGGCRTQVAPDTAVKSLKQSQVIEVTVRCEQVGSAHDQPSPVSAASKHVLRTAHLGPGASNSRSLIRLSCGPPLTLTWNTTLYRRLLVPMEHSVAY